MGAKPKKPTGIGFVDNAEICKRRAISYFNQNYRRTQNKDEAYASTRAVLKKCIQQRDIKNARAVTGLEAELLFYYLGFDSYQLSPEMAQVRELISAGLCRKNQLQ